MHRPVGDGRQLPQTYVHRDLTNDVRGIAVQGRKDGLFRKWCWDNCPSIWKKMRILSSHQHESGGFKPLNMKPKTRKYLKYRKMGLLAPSRDGVLNRTEKEQTK